MDALRTVADTSSMQDAHEALVAAVFTVQKEMACLKETIRKVKTIPPEQPAAQVEQTEVIREVREKTAGAKAQSKITGKLSSQTSRLETMLRRKNPEKRLAEKYTHEERQQAMKELDEMIATATRLREIIAKVERSADEAQKYSCVSACTAKFTTCLRWKHCGRTVRSVRWPTASCRRSWPSSGRSD